MNMLANIVRNAGDISARITFPCLRPWFIEVLKQSEDAGSVHRVYNGNFSCILCLWTIAMDPHALVAHAPLPRQHRLRLVQLPAAAAGAGRGQLLAAER